ncbi:proton-translocating NADH-quinone o [Cystobasidium minutum MCA 4210]|uniref:proton-translocating NADH-quinone o n=1 Tax=Cystobasidium minutum MCA 4210 TaxID=1397322 RepID=UPI0034CF1131|eukprot:jgi/Rhomi1/186771/estExt_fgenesh1_pm.C_190001
MYLTILALPLLGAITAGFLGRKIGVTGAHVITCTLLVISALLSIVAFYEVGLSGSPSILTVSMLLPVLIVSSLVHIFSVDYMAADPHNQRFFSYLSMFTFFMLVLVAGDNYLANKSAIKALTVNRVGDMFLSVVFGNLDYSTVFSLSPFINESALTIIGLLLLLAAMGKSAQLVGALTAFFAATTGLLQNDIKRVIAYSTCSQMGYLQYNVALFHLVNHAFFKALLFLAAGGVLHSMQDQQDLRKLGGLINFLPFTYTAILVGSLSLMAFPFLTGFFSKDLILELAYGQYEFSGTITAMITAFYSFRLISMTFLTYPNAPKGDYEHTHEQPLIVVVPYVILSLLAIFFGYLAKDLFVGPGSDFLSSALFIHPTHITLVEAEFGIPLFYKLLPAAGSILTGGPGYAMYKFFNGKYFFDVIYNNYIINKALSLGLVTSKVLDRGLVEKIGPFGLTGSFYNTSRQLATLDTGIITSYALYIILGLISITLLLFVPVLRDTTGSVLRLVLLFVAGLVAIIG